MALPEQIRKQAEAVQQLYQQLNQDDGAGTSDASADGTDSVEGGAAVENNADNNTAPNTVTSASGNEHNANAENVPEDNPNSESYAQKWRTLQGMYNAEVPRLHQQNRELAQRVQQLEQLLATMSAQPAATSQSQQATQLVTEKDVEEYGESIDMMRKVSREELFSVAQRLDAIEQALRQMQTNVVPQVQAVAQRQQLSAEQQFWTDLAAMVPTFREVNNNPDFQSWLLEADPLTGITRQTYLDDAQRSLDARRVANFFHAWLEKTGQASVAQSTGRASGSELERQMAPGRSKSTGTPTSSKGKMYTPADIRMFFDAVRSGKYKGREQERDRIERDIFAAQREGRIID